jgi:hypothetical protein
MQLQSRLSSALGGREWSTPRPGRFALGREIRYLRLEDAGCAPKPVWKGTDTTNLLPPPVLEPGTVQQVTKRYTDYAIPGQCMGYEQHPTLNLKPCLKIV